MTQCFKLISEHSSLLYPLSLKNLILLYLLSYHFKYMSSDCQYLLRLQSMARDRQLQAWPDDQ